MTAEILLYRASGEGRIAAGQHLVVAFKHARGRVTLLDCGALIAERVPLTELQFAQPAKKVKPRSLAARLDRKRRQRKRLGMRCPERTVNAVVAALREASK